ncbi:hypothetical protein CW370_06030 [Bacillus sp. SN32]|nr:hypothetical protein CW370_06030 [Bacillus sp. SN32]
MNNVLNIQHIFISLRKSKPDKVHLTYLFGEKLFMSQKPYKKRFIFLTVITCIYFTIVVIVIKEEGTK